MNVKGHVRGLSTFYAESGLERVEIWVEKDKAGDLPYEIGKRVPIEFSIQTETFLAGLRATEKTTYVWVSPDLLDENRQKVSLAMVLDKYDVTKNQEIVLQVEGTRISLVL